MTPGSPSIPKEVSPLASCKEQKGGKRMEIGGNRMDFVVECRSTVDGAWNPARQFDPDWQQLTGRDAVDALEILCGSMDLPLSEFRVRRALKRTRNHQRRANADPR